MVTIKFPSLLFLHRSITEHIGHSRGLLDHDHGRQQSVGITIYAIDWMPPRVIFQRCFLRYLPEMVSGPSKSIFGSRQCRLTSMLRKWYKDTIIPPGLKCGREMWNTKPQRIQRYGWSSILQKVTQQYVWSPKLWLRRRREVRRHLLGLTTLAPARSHF